ncbi:ABC transporter ATP-binding protein [Burkholderia guangdongensis]|uniref:ABC transporter ATP-binding protein n=1 Tax=Burkholderia guangdongensis TaxID=1792500 RepID=UPI0015C80388|nr:ABC transporter ATP-binding protein [Burkholderia guangdongensis]
MGTDLDRAGALRILFELAAGRRLVIVAALLATLLAVLAELAPFVLLYLAVDTLIASPHAFASRLLELAPWLLGSLLAKYAAYGTAYLISHHAAYAIIAHARHRLITQLDHAPLHWLHAQGAGALKQSVIQDVERLEAFLAHHTVEVTAAVLAPVCVTLLLLWIDWRMALAVLAVGPLALLTAAIVMRGAGRNHDRFNQATASLNNVTVEYLRNMAVLKVFCRTASSFRLLERRLREYYRLAGRITRKTVPGWALFTSVLGAHMLFLLPLGAWLHARGEVTAAQVAIAVLLGAGVFRPLLKVSRFFMEIPPILAGLLRMAPILAFTAPGERRRIGGTASIQVELNDVQFRYGTRQVLDTVNLRLEPGTFNVLVGASGSGKSTIALLVAGILAPDSGTVTLDGRPVATLEDADRARQIALATQDVFLFHGTIRDNLCLARPGATRQEIRKAVRVAQAEPLLRELPAGYETQVNELGARLSGGERQRIAVARALLADTPVLILDEATAFADSLTQRAFYQALLDEYPEKTLLVVAHRLYGIEKADQILVLDGGRISVSGRHADLLRESEYYRAMWRCEELTDEWALGASDWNAAARGPIGLDACGSVLAGSNAAGG